MTERLWGARAAGEEGFAVAVNQSICSALPGPLEISGSRGASPPRINRDLLACTCWAYAAAISFTPMAAHLFVSCVEFLLFPGNTNSPIRSQGKERHVSWGWIGASVDLRVRGAGDKRCPAAGAAQLCTSCPAPRCSPRAPAAGREGDERHATPARVTPSAVGRDGGHVPGDHRRSAPHGQPHGAVRGAAPAWTGPKGEQPRDCRAAREGTAADTLEVSSPFEVQPLPSHHCTMLTTVAWG